MQIAILLFEGITPLDAVDAGSPRTAPPAIVASLRARSRFILEGADRSAG